MMPATAVDVFVAKLLVGLPSRTTSTATSMRSAPGHEAQPEAGGTGSQTKAGNPYVQCVRGLRFPTTRPQFLQNLARDLLGSSLLEEHLSAIACKLIGIDAHGDIPTTCFDKIGLGELNRPAAGCGRTAD